MKIKNYEELKKRKMAHLTREEFEGEKLLQEMEARIGIHGPEKDTKPSVISTGSFRSDLGDYDREGIEPRV